MPTTQTKSIAALQRENAELREQLVDITKDINEAIVIVIGHPPTGESHAHNTNEESMQVDYGDAELVIHIDAELKTAAVIKNVRGSSGHHAMLFVDRHLTIDYWQARQRETAAEWAELHTKAQQLHALLHDAWWMKAAALLHEIGDE